jgi:hypothetical protein
MSKIFNKTIITVAILIIGLAIGVVIKAENQKKLEAKEVKRQALLEEYKDSPMRHVLKNNHTGDDVFLMCCENMGMKPEECVQYLQKKKQELKN